MGLVLGAIVASVGPSARSAAGLLISVSVALAGVTLYASTPAPQYVGRIIDAEVADCAAPSTAVDAAMARWDRQVARANWAAARPGWRQDLESQAQSDGGVVLQLRVIRERLVYENQKPWNRGTLWRVPWQDSNTVTPYYARFGGGDCTHYSDIARALYFPTPDSESSPAWPPHALPNLLGLLVLKPVPSKYADLTHE